MLDLQLLELRDFFLLEHQRFVFYRKFVNSCFKTHPILETKSQRKKLT